VHALSCCPGVTRQDANVMVELQEFISSAMMI
jgi:hypothetical protein